MVKKEKIEGKLLYAGEEHDGMLAVDVLFKGKKYGGYIPRIGRL